MQCIKCDRLLFFIKQLQDIEIANNVIYISTNQQGQSAENSIHHQTLIVLVCVLSTRWSRRASLPWRKRALNSSSFLLLAEISPTLLSPVPSDIQEDARESDQESSDSSICERELGNIHTSSRRHTTSCRHSISRDSTVNLGVGAS